VLDFDQNLFNHFNQEIMEYASLARPCFNIEFINKALTKPFSTKLGGIPDVPLDFVWPTVNSLCYMFLVQYNCAQLPPEFHQAGFPQSGMVSIFIPNYSSGDEDESRVDDVRIYYFSDTKNLAPYSQKTYTFEKSTFQQFPARPFNPELENDEHDDVLLYLQNLRNSLNQKTIATDSNSKKTKQNTIIAEESIQFLDEYSIMLVPETSYPHAYLFEDQYSKIYKKKLNSKELEKIQDTLAIEQNYILGWPYAAQGLEDDIMHSPDEWINMITLTGQMDWFEMYDGHVPESVSVIINKRDLQKQHWNKARAYQHWD
jgi:hypothetical protein